MKFLVVLPLLAALATAAPQYATVLRSSPAFTQVVSQPAASVTTATTRNSAAQIGNTHLSHHSKSVENEHSAVHRFDSRTVTPQQTVLRRRVVAAPATTHLVHNSPVAVATSPVVTRTSTVASNDQTLFQTADGRFFALNGANSNVAPGQIFQTADGRFFSVGVNAAAAPAQEEEAEDEDNANDDALIVAERTRQRIQQQQEEEEEEKEEEEEDEAAVTRTITTGQQQNFVRFGNTQTPVFFTSQPRTAAATHFVQQQPAAVRTQFIQQQPAAVRTHFVQQQPTAVRTQFVQQQPATATHFVQQPAAVRTVVATNQQVAHDIPYATSFRTFPHAARTHAFTTADLASSGFVVLNQPNVQFEF